MTSLEIHDAQKARDRKHHEERVAWLSAERPVDSNGELISAEHKNRWLKQSLACLAAPSGMTGYNTGPKEEES